VLVKLSRLTSLLPRKSHKMTMSKPQNEADEASQEQAGRQRKPRKPGQEKWHIYLEPEDADGELEFMLSMNASRDPVAYIQRSEDFEAGTYLIKKARASGQIMESFAHTKTERPEAGNFEGREEDRFSFSPEHMDDEDERTARIVAATVRALKEDERHERATQNQPSTIETLRELDEIAERRAAQLRSIQPAQQSTDPMDGILKMVNGLKTLGIVPDKTDQLEVDPEDRFLERLQKYTNISKKINGIPATEEDGSFLGKTTAIVKELREVAPVLAPVLQTWLLSRAAKNGIQLPVIPPMPPQPTPEPEPQLQQQAATEEASDEDSPLTLNDIVSNIKVAIQSNEKPDECVNDIAMFVSDNPVYAPSVEQMMSATNPELMELIATATGADVSLLANANKFLDGLRKGVRARLQPQPAQSFTSNNGHNSTIDVESIQPS
jgi:hypothetical protein